MSHVFPRETRYFKFSASRGGELTSSELQALSYEEAVKCVPDYRLLTTDYSKGIIRPLGTFFKEEGKLRKQ